MQLQVKAVRNAIVAIVAGLGVMLASAGIASAHSTGTITAKVDGAAVAKASATLFHGHSKAAGGNVHSGAFTVTDPRRDGHAVYGKLTGTHDAQRYQARPGGRQLIVRKNIGDGTAKTRTTQSRTSQGLMLRVSDTRVLRYTTKASACRDVRYAPDTCASRAYTS
ncbi:hypothetical protein [Isoptericola croceus]|uniref:hypothetical protein n=1 Tax=Isoptericola croceus TaxID=3031406 RepID=UPI0023F90250|nr:hypothetical protein [Isoptericola croceus]